MSFTVATSIYNAQRMGFAWRSAFSNWLDFLSGEGQLVIAINTSDDDTPAAVRAWVKQWQEEHTSSATVIDVLDIAIPYTNPAFDGLGKAAATAAAKQPFVILLDLDERLVPSQRKLWLALTCELERSPVEALFIPVVDLIGERDRFKSIGSKFYLHKNLPHLTRGVVKHAWNEDGVTWRTDVSDSCELIHRETGALAVTAAIMAELPDFLKIGQLESGAVPFVYHLGFLEAEQRVRQSAFWRPIWNARCGNAKEEPETTLETLAAIPRYRHSLPDWEERAS